MIEAVIFDMDGVLIDSEPLWQQVERDIFAGYGVKIDADMIKQTLGLQADEVIQHWYQYKPWPNLNEEKIIAEFYKRIVVLVNGANILMEGAAEAVEMARSHGLKTGIASSSPQLMLDSFMEKYQMHDLFEAALTSEDDGPGKPHPAVYLSAAQALGVDPKNCLAVEDSVNGMVAAKAAKMKTIVVPDKVHFEDKRYQLADARLRSLKEFTYELIRSMD
jgi:HAD superfamily hydrolase (TIGR01509 family)